jgi:aryl-alcohol dehydrogenase-like predicted oxidoreductase
VLFGATSAAQIAENVAALEVDAATLQRITA